MWKVRRADRGQGTATFCLTDYFPALDMQHATQHRQHKLMVWSRQTLLLYCYYWTFQGMTYTVWHRYLCQARVKKCWALISGGWFVFVPSLPYLTSSPQVPQDDWSGFSPLGKDDEIPCRRMRSGSYIKAMAEEDSGDSDCSPKPSPKVQARRASYLKATQPSLTEMTTLK